MTLPGLPGALSSLDEGQIGAILVTIARAGALAGTAPVIGETGVPMRAKLVFVVALGLSIGINRSPIPLANVPASALVELAYGILTGLTARFIMTRVANAGQLMGLSLGLGFASEYDVHAGESAQTLRMLATTLASIAFISVGGLDQIARATAAGPAHITQLMSLGPDLIQAGTSAFGHGLMLAGPIVLAALVGNIGLAVMNRAAPAVNVFSVSLPLILIIGGIVLMAGSAGFVGSVVEIAREAADVIR